jgi:hypothetical protein
VSLVFRELSCGEREALCLKYDVVGPQHRLDNLLFEYGGNVDAIPEELLAEIGYTRAAYRAEQRQRRLGMARVPGLVAEGVRRDVAITFAHLDLRIPRPVIVPRAAHGRARAPRSRRTRTVTGARGDPDESDPASAGSPKPHPLGQQLGRIRALLDAHVHPSSVWRRLRADADAELERQLRGLG